jgi:hypothetical protein
MRKWGGKEGRREKEEDKKKMGKEKLEEKERKNRYVFTI